MKDLIFNEVNGGVCAPKGFKAGGIHSGIRRGKDKLDLALICSDVLCNCAAVYTQNKVYGAPITVTRKNIADGKARAVICNSGNANTCNADGVEKAQAMAALTADALGISPSDVVVASTGVIGQVLDITPIETALPALSKKISYEGALDAANAIMTTDTQVKQVALSAMIGSTKITLGAMAKGSGMIHPNMATMLCFMTTDCAITHEMLQKALSIVVKDTFNMISVDGDTSTNDMVCLLSDGLAKNEMIKEEGEAFEVFCALLKTAATTLSKKIASDGEGATKLVECNVSGACTEENAKVLAKAVISSSLVKCALFGSDANWGRILCAAGYSGADFNAEAVDVSFSSECGEIAVCKNSKGLEFDEDTAKKILLCDEIKINICLNDGEYAATAWGCDLSYDYVKINGDYRS